MCVCACICACVYARLTVPLGCLGSIVSMSEIESSSRAGATRGRRVRSEQLQAQARSAGSAGLIGSADLVCSVSFADSVVVAGSAELTGFKKSGGSYA
jgi:hypothetical protein